MTVNPKERNRIPKECQNDETVSSSGTRHPSRFTDCECLITAETVGFYERANHKSLKSREAVYTEVCRRMTQRDVFSFMKLC